MQERRRSHGTASPSSWLSVSSLSAQNPPHLSVEGERVKYTGKNDNTIMIWQKSLDPFLMIGGTAELTIKSRSLASEHDAA